MLHMQLIFQPLLRRLALAALGAGLAASAPAVAGERHVPVVVELFTSQGCDTCPPADVCLGEVKKRSDIVALSMHVDYWDYIGWKDPYAQHAFTMRQRQYSTALSQRYVYTPQMVINGRLQGIGSERPEMEKLIVQAKKQHEAEAANLPTIKLVGHDVHIGPGPAVPATLWIAIFHPHLHTAVHPTENAGRDLVEHNVVREWTKLGTYDGDPVTLKLDVDMDEYEKSGCAIFVQRQTATGPGAILAAYAIDPPLRGK